MFTHLLRSRWTTAFAVTLQIVAYPFFYYYVISKAPWLSDYTIKAGWVTDFLDIFRIKLNVPLTIGYIAVTLFEGYAFYYLRLAFNTFYPLVWADRNEVQLTADDYVRLQKQARLLLALAPLFLLSVYFCYYDIHASALGLTTGNTMINGQVQVTHVDDALTTIFMWGLAGIITLSTELIFIFSKNFSLIEMLFSASSFEEMLEEHAKGKHTPAEQPAKENSTTDLKKAKADSQSR